MATEPEKTRKTHVWRAKNQDDEEIWLDLERVDKIISNEEGQGGLYRKTTRKMFWGDETGAEPHPTRKTKELRIENPEDEDTFVTVRAIEKQITNRGQGLDYKKVTKKFRNDKETNEVRKFSVRRVHHWDTITDPSQDGGLDYARIDGTEDRSQYVDVAVIEKIVQTRGQGLSYKKRTFKFNTAPIKEFSEPSPGNVDPADVVWLDPWQNIINVQWGGYRLVAFFMAQNGAVEFDIQFAGPKTHYTLGELNELERNGQKVQVPVLGPRIGVETDTFSANGSYSGELGGPLIITGTRLAAAEPIGAPDFRGYTTLDVREWDEEGEIKLETGEHIYYDFNWEPADAGDIPEASERGALLTSSNGVSVYVRLHTGAEATRGVTAYFEGNVLWRIGPENLPDTVNYNSQTERIELTYYSLPDSGNPGVEFYRLNGTRASVTDFGDNYSPGDVSRNGKSYVFMDSEDTTDSIRGLSRSGATLWTIPGESFDTGWLWGSVTAYGEDYLVVTAFQNIPDIDGAQPAHHNIYRIYDAHTGALVSQHALTDDIRTVNDNIGEPGATNITVTDNQLSYGHVNGLFRSAYWP